MSAGDLPELSEIDSKHVPLSYFKITQIAFNNDIFLVAFTIERTIEKLLALREIDLFSRFCRRRLGREAIVVFLKRPADEH